ncbi:filamin [Planctomycetota bacterium]|nr:filamin [Planctomycetota bacterium]
MLACPSLPLSLLIVVLASLGVALAGDPPANDAVFIDQHLKPFIQNHCISCHGGTKAKGDARFDATLTASSIGQQRALWQRAYFQLQDGTMPPSDRPQPEPAQRQAIVEGLHRLLATCGSGEARPPGRVTLRRLNRSQYRNTVQDLLRIDLDPTGLLPADQVGYGFDHIGDVLTVPPALLGTYLSMARDLAAAAIVAGPDEVAPVVARLEWPANRHFGKGMKRYSGDYLSKPLPFTCEVPDDDEYLLKIQLLTERSGDKPLLLRIDLGDKEIARLPVEATSFTWFRQRIRLAAGPNALSFRRELAEGTDPKTNPAILIERVLVTRPSAVLPEHYPEAHRRIMIAEPSAKLPAREAAKRILRPLATRAYRRAADDAQVEGLLKVFDAATTAGGSFPIAIRSAVMAMLCSPRFLFLIEQDPAKGKPDRQIDEPELAVRLSYFLWNSMPDEPLLDLATAGKLRAGLAGEIARMLADQRFVAACERFTSQWLSLETLESFRPDANLPEFKGYGELLRRAMVREPALLLAAILREDRPLTELISSTFTHVDAQLANFYGVPVQKLSAEAQEQLKTGAFVRIDAPPNRTSGLLSQLAVLTATSYPTRTSPVIRGAWILENLLGAPAPPPPPNIPDLVASTDGKPLNLRAQLGKHRANAACAICHDRIDPLGFALEGFGPMGGIRDKYGDNSKIDTTGVMPGGEKLEGVDGLRKFLLGPKRDAFIRNLARNLLTFAIARPVEDADACTVNDLVAAVAADGGKSQALIRAIIASPAFQRRQATK